MGARLVQVPGHEIQELRALGERYAREHDVRSSILVGYGNTALWGTEAHVAIVGHLAPGGPVILGGGKPIGMVEKRWFPLLEVDGFTYAFQGREIDSMSLTAAVASEAAVLTGALALLPGTPDFFEFLGFLQILKQHEDGLVCG